MPNCHVPLVAGRLRRAAYGAGAGWTQMRQRRRGRGKPSVTRGSIGQLRCEDALALVQPYCSSDIRQLTRCFGKWTKPTMAEATQRRRTRPAWLALWLLAAALAVAAGGWWWFGPASGTPSQARARTPPAAPVHTAIVETKSFPVVLNGLGTVQATNTVTVRSRVDGQIERVAFEEGQMVNAGELLVQIDPAPLQAALNKALVKLAQDRASLTNARQDLDRTTILSRQGDATQQLLDQRTANVASLSAQVQADEAAV